MKRKTKNSWMPKPLMTPKHVDMVFKMEELEQDIATLCSVVGESHDQTAAAGEPSATTLTKDVLDDGNRELIRRGIDKTLKEVMMLLYPYTKTPLSICYTDNEIPEVEAYVIELTFDYDRSDVQTMYLESQIHDYVVKKSVFDWLSYTMVPTQRVSDVQMQQRKFLEESEFAKGNIATALAEPMEIKNHHVRSSFF